MERHATKDGKCSNCGRCAVLHSTGECSWCTPVEELRKEEPQGKQETKSQGPTLAASEEEKQRMLYAGRSSVSLRESKVYDKERLIDAPLFRAQGRLF